MPRTPQPSFGPLHGSTSRKQAQHRNGRGSSAPEDGDTSRIPYRAQSTTSFLSTADILGSFKLPETQPVFKVEPTEPDIMKLPLRSSKKTKHDRPNVYAIAPRKRQTGTAPKYGVSTGRTDSDQDHGDTGTDASIQQQNTFVDLTAEDNGDEDEERVESSRRDNELMIQRPSEIPHFGPFAAFAPVANDKIPEVTLRHIREQYQKDRISLPANISRWQQLLEFSSANTKPTLITPALIVQWCSSFWSSGTPQPNVSPCSQHSSVFLQNTVKNQDLFHDQTEYVPFIPDASTPSRDAHRSSPASKRGVEVIQRARPDTSTEPNTRTERPATRPSDKRTATHTRSHPRTTNAARDVGNIPAGHDFATSQRYGVQGANIVDVSTLMRPFEALPQLLPSSAAVGHPHLVPVWHPYLLKLPRIQHDHLNLVDTVISIMAKYDMKEQSVIKAFLDMDQVQHFFFLFKSRSNVWHSWSVEREYNIVTVSCSCPDTDSSVALRVSHHIGKPCNC